MKLMFASDIHGSKYYCEKMLQRFKDEKVEKLIILGDLLYHGPRNDLPKEYSPKDVIKMLNMIKNDLLVVRGNCDAEVDQMVLEFPIMADYAYLMLNNKKIFITHGHMYSSENISYLSKGDIFIQGHTHIYISEKRGENYFLNPGSVSLAKNGNPNTYAIMENEIFWIKDMEGNIVEKFVLK